MNRVRHRQVYPHSDDFRPSSAPAPLANARPSRYGAAEIQRALALFRAVGRAPTRRHATSLVRAMSAINVLGEAPWRYAWLLEAPRVTLLAELGRLATEEQIREVADRLCESRPSTRSGERELRRYRQRVGSFGRATATQSLVFGSAVLGPARIVLERIETGQLSPAWVERRGPAVELRSTFGGPAMVRASNWVGVLEQLAPDVRIYYP